MAEKKSKNHNREKLTVLIDKDIKKEILSNKVALISMIILLIIIVASLLAPLSSYDPNKIDVADKLQGISSKHWFGTDEYGRDYFTRALYGGRISLMVGFCSMIMTIIIGTVIGVTSGYLGGKVDMLLMRFTDIFLALPSMLLMVVLNTILRPSLVTLIAVLSLFSWAQVARITRAETMSVKERDFVTAAKNLGTDIAIGITGTTGNLDPNNADSVQGVVYFCILYKTQAHTFTFQTNVSGMTRHEIKQLYAEQVFAELEMILTSSL